MLNDKLNDNFQRINQTTYITQPIQNATYGKRTKFSADKFYNIDPRPLHLRETTTQEINNFVKDLQASSMELCKESNWESVFQIE